MNINVGVAAVAVAAVIGFPSVVAAEGARVQHQFVVNITTAEGFYRDTGRGDERFPLPVPDNVGYVCIRDTLVNHGSYFEVPVVCIEARSKTPNVVRASSICMMAEPDRNETVLRVGKVVGKSTRMVEIHVSCATVVAPQADRPVASPASEL